MPPSLAHNLSSTTTRTITSTDSDTLLSLTRRPDQNSPNYSPPPSMAQIQQFQANVMSYVVNKAEDLPWRFQYGHGRGDGWGEDRYDEAMDNLVFMSRLLSQPSKKNMKMYGGGHAVLIAHSSWRTVSERIKYTSRPNPEPGRPPFWSVLEMRRPCVQDDHLSVWVRNPDTSRPHIFGMLASDDRIEDGTILTGEAQGILMLACNYGVQPEYQHHKLIPVSLLTSSKRTFRVVQGIVDLRTKDVEIRLSKKVKLPDGPSGNCETYYTLLGWMLASLVDETLKG